MELLLTSPITDAQIVGGKFIGAMALYACMLAVTAVYMGVLFMFGNPEGKPLVAGYLGLLLLGASFIAVGIFISSTTKNQMVAGTATFVVLLLLWIISWLADGAGPTAAAILNYLSVTQHFDDFGKGIIDTKHVVFYLSVVSFALFLTLKSTDAERWRG
jgi:ABC-2 type transport system permease protein